MPNPVRAYSCSWGCHRRVLTSKATMAKHELTCAKNPARRACKTCEHRRSACLSSDRPGVVQVEASCAVHALPYARYMAYNCEKWMLVKLWGES